MRYVMDRRTLLGAACVGCAAVATGCGGDSEAADPAPATSAPAAGAAAPLAQLADLVQGEAVAVTSGGTNVLLTRTGADTVVAFNARCTHQGCKVEPAGQELACPCHGSRFKAADGSVINGPAAAPLATFPVSVANGAVVAA